MMINFPRGVIVDADNAPENFEELIRESFRKYTKGTAKDYMYQDKLRYIDVCRQYLHKAGDAEECVMELMKDRFECAVREEGEIPDKEDYLSIEFMADCFEHGRTDLYANYTGDRRKDEKIMKLMERVIKVVINYEPE